MGRRAAVIVSLVVLGIALAGPTWAGDGDMLVRFGVEFSSPTGDLSDGDQTTELDSATGFFVGFEWGLNDLMSLGADLSSLSYDVKTKEAGMPDLLVGETDLLEVTVALNFQLLRDSRVDLYAGPLIGYAMWDDIDSDLFATSFKTDDEFVYGGIFGVDCPIGESWSVGGALRYTLSDLKVPGGAGDIGVDPFDVQIGVAYTF